MTCTPFKQMFDCTLSFPTVSLGHQVIAPATLFLAAKVEEQPRKLEHVIKVTHACLNPQDPSPDVRSDVSIPKYRTGNGFFFLQEITLEDVTEVYVI